MKKNALYKDIYRNLKQSKGRFFSIVAIIALGVAFYSGLKIAPEAMKATADKYYDDYNLMDVRLVSSLGLTDGDLEEVKKIDGVERAEGTYFIDALVEEGESENVFRVHNYRDQDQINGFRLVQGRLPESANECLIEKGGEEELRFPLGSKIKLESGGDEDLKDSLENTEYTVVGAVQTPYYLSFEKGNSSIGNGRVSGFIAIPEENFDMDVYTDIYLTVKDSKEFNSYKDEYFDLIDPVVEELESIAPIREKARYDAIISDVEKELDEAEEEFQEAEKEVEAELAQALDEIKDGERELAEAGEEIRKAQLEINNNQAKLRDSQLEFDREIANARNQISQAESDLASGIKEYEEGKDRLEEEKKTAEAEFQEAQRQLAEAEIKKDELYTNLQEIELALSNPELGEEERIGLEYQKEEIKEGIKEIESKIELGRNNLEEGKGQLEAAQAKLDSSYQEIEAARTKIEDEKENLVQAEKQGRQELDSGRRQLEEGKQELAQARIEVEEARVELEEGRTDYEEGKQEAYEELEDAREKIADAKREVRKIEKASWHILDRESHYSYVDYGGAADRIDALAKVFPLFFAMVAALVCLTSMARMVDEQRGIIGTLKALGYSNWDISLKYIIYALLASLVGSIIGFAVGYTIFPIIIFNAYGLMYELPKLELVFNPRLTFIVSLVTITLITATAYLATMSSLRENSASLMRPKAPKIGKRIFLERIPFLWKRFNFSQKVTLRNIFRYKRRFFMTVFGVAGCTALMLAGFGIRDSIQTIHDRQFSEVLKYDLSISMDSEDIGKVKDERIKDQTIIRNEAASIRSAKEEKDLTIVVPSKLEEIDRYIRLGDRQSQKEIDFPKDEIAISEQVSRALNIKPGDEILLINNDNQEAKIKIDIITENYTFNYIYMSAENYKEIYGKEAEYNTILANMDNPSRELEEELSRDLLKTSRVTGIEFNSLMEEEFSDLIFSLNYIVILMIVFAGALAFVVLYNLTNINISERLREIATIKVLGFYDNEVSAYIYRENIILTVFGVIAGSVIGIYLHKYIMTTVEMDNIMFGLSLNPMSYFYATILTFIFSILVNFSMHFKLKEIDMVESLKSVE